MPLVHRPRSDEVPDGPVIVGEDLNMTDIKPAEEIDKDLEVVKEWMKMQPHLPQNIDEQILRRFLHSCYYSLERTKKCIDLFFTLRTASSDMLKQRDPTSQHMRTVLEITNLALIRLRDQSNLFIWQLNDPGMERYDYLADARLFFSQSDVWMLEDRHMENRDIVVLDAKDVSMKFLTKLNVSAAKKLGQYQQEALPVRLKEVHIVNAPGYIDKIFSLMKAFIKPEICAMIHFHAANSDTLYKFLNREELPADYGGNAPRMEVFMKEWVQKLQAHRDFLLDDKQWCADESKRPTLNKLAQPSIQNGSFRKLEFD